MTKYTAILPIETLSPFDRNTRTHSKAQVKQIAESIKQFGFTNPVLVDQHNKILAGHGRVAAAELLGLKEVPTLRIDHLTEAEKRSYVIADNRLAEKAGWDKEILAMELRALIDLDVDVTVTGFDIPEVDLIIGEFSPDNRDDDVETENALPKKPAVTCLGDLFLLDRHRLLCGDSLLSESFEALMQGEKASIIFEDPPFNVRVSGFVAGRGKAKHREFAMASGEMSESEFADFLNRSFAVTAQNMEPGAVAYVCMDWRHVAETIMAGKGALGDLLNLCVWAKSNAGMGSFYRSQHELVLVFRNSGAPHRNNVELGKHGRNRSNVWNYRGANAFGSTRLADLEAHPTVKPVNLVADALLDASRRGDVVLDPFGGSGTTLMAAHKTGRRARLIEIDPLYCDHIIRRFENHTGKAATHADTGETFEELCARRRTGAK